MLRTILLTGVLFFAWGTSILHAKIFRIGFGGKVPGVDFDYFDVAVLNVAVTGDTIQFYQYHNAGNNFVTITKRLVLLGLGYMLDKNSGLQATPVAEKEVDLFFGAGSEGSVVKGLNLRSVHITANNITISRCRVTAGLNLGGYDNSSGQYRSVSNVVVSGNFISGEINNQRAAGNLLVTNNIIAGRVVLDSSSGSFANNTVFNYYNDYTFHSFLVKNNIFSFSYGECLNAPESIFQNNLFSVSPCATITGDGNRFDVNMSNVFVNWNDGVVETDNQLVLKAGSPAIGAGLKNDGLTVTDAGAFGGETGYVYKLSGIPNIPSIYRISAPSQNAVANPYTITVSVRSNN